MHYLYARYVDDVFGYVQSIVRDHHEAQDITQNIFAKLITAIRKYEERSVPFAAWITRVARNATLDHLRARRQIPVEEVRVSDPVDDQLGSERRQCLKDALAPCRWSSAACSCFATCSASPRRRSPTGSGSRRARSTGSTIAGAPP